MKTSLKKAIASGVIGLTALGGTAAFASPAFAQDAERTPLTEAERAERQAEREARRAEKVAALSDVLGLSADELQAAREAGTSLTDLAAQQGVPMQSVIDALVANAQARVDAKLAAGDIDAERAAEISERIEARAEARANGESPEGRRGHGPRGQRGGAPAADAGI